MARANFKTHLGNNIKLEVCVDSIASAIAAQEGGADRIELCDFLAAGGTTPSAGMIETVRKYLKIDVYVLIRPRRGDFLYSKNEFEVMKRDIEMCRNMGVNGVVIGMLTKDASIDLARVTELIEIASPLQITFHRAFDLTAEPMKAFEELLTLPVHRLLTSGQQACAQDGIPLIQSLNKISAGKIKIMPGSGINKGNVSEIITNTGVTEIHASLRSTIGSRMANQKKYPPMSDSLNLSEYEQKVADTEKIKEIKKILSLISSNQ